MDGTNANDPSISWRDVAKDLQQNFLNTFGESDWDAFEYSERHWLEKRVGYALCGPPDSIPTDGDEGWSGYSAKQQQNIREVCDAIVQADIHGQGHAGDTWMSMVFVCVEIPVKHGEEPYVKPVPVFRVPQFSAMSKETMLFVDYNARVYVSWKDFLRHNELPKCNYCYPKNGIYTADNDDNVLVDFGSSPASKISMKMLSVLDHASNALIVGTTAVSVASMFVPVAGPFIAASMWGGISVGMYGAVRATGALVDRKKHRQCVCIKNSEARNHWLSLVGNAVGAASAKAVNTVSKLAQTGQIIGKTGRLAVNALNVSSLTINGIGVVNNAFVLHNKHKNKELTQLDIFQFSASILFFAHAAVTLRTADMIIKDRQNAILEQFESNRYKKMFRKIASGAVECVSDTEGQGKVIRSLMHIDNPDDFFAGLGQIGRQIQSNQSEGIFKETGLIENCQNLSIQPSTSSHVNEEQYQVILQATRSLADGKCPEVQLQSVVPTLIQEHTAQHTSDSSACNISEILGLDIARRIQNSGQRAFSNINSLEKVDVLKEIMKYFDSVLHHTLMELSIRLSGLMRWVHKLQDILKFVCEAIFDTAIKMENKYQDDLKYARNLHGSNFNQEEFDRDYKIEGKRFKHFCNIVVENYIKNPVLISFLMEAFAYWINRRSSTRENIQIHDQVDGVVDHTSNNHLAPEVGICTGHDFRGDIGCKCNDEQPYIIPRRFSTGDKFEFLPPDEVFKVAREVTGLEIDESKCILQYFGCDVTVLLPPGSGIKSVSIKRDIENNNITAHINH